MSSSFNFDLSHSSPDISISVHGRQLVHRVGQRLVIHDGAYGEDVLLAAFVVLDYPGQVVDQELHQGLDVHDVQSGRV